MKYLIIGLGIYGSNLARDLAAMGHEVIGADRDTSVVDTLKDYLSTVYCVDSTDPTALAVLPFKNVDLVIVAIGENFGASVKTVALLKQAGVEHIYARAIDPLHHAILECFNLDRILIPEQRAAADLSRELLLGQKVTTMAITQDLFVVKFRAPEMFVGERYSDVGAETGHADGMGNLRIVAATRPEPHKGLLHTSSTVQVPLDLHAEGLRVEDGDVLVCITGRKALERLLR